MPLSLGNRPVLTGTAAGIVCALAPIDARHTADGPELREVLPLVTAAGPRYTSGEPTDLQSETDVRIRDRRAGGQTPAVRQLQFFDNEGVRTILDASTCDGGTVFVQGAPDISRDAGLRQVAGFQFIQDPVDGRVG
jgi:hypothetical protein